LVEYLLHKVGCDTFGIGEHESFQAAGNVPEVRDVLKIGNGFCKLVSKFL
jgi:hypothetical protein